MIGLAEFLAIAFLLPNSNSTIMAETLDEMLISRLSFGISELIVIKED